LPQALTVAIDAVTANVQVDVPPGEAHLLVASCSASGFSTLASAIGECVGFGSLPRASRLFTIWAPID
jgi:hypothetical protein